MLGRAYGVAGYGVGLFSMSASGMPIGGADPGETEKARINHTQGLVGPPREESGPTVGRAVRYLKIRTSVPIYQ